MKKWFVIGMTALALAAASNIGMAGEQDFTLVNQTGYELDQLYVSPAASKEWHEDILGQDTLADGQSVKIKFSPDNAICKYDLKVVYTIDKSEVQWGSIDLCKEEKITIHWNKETDESSATFE